MSETPKTDALVRVQFANHPGWKTHPVVEHARQLERENAALRDEVEALREDKARLRFLIDHELVCIGSENGWHLEDGNETMISDKVFASWQEAIDAARKEGGAK